MNNSLCVVICSSFVAAYSSFLMVSYVFFVGWFFFSQFFVKQKMAGEFCKFYVFLSFSFGFCFLFWIGEKSLEVLQSLEIIQD